MPGLNLGWRRKSSAPRMCQQLVEVTARAGKTG
jgi:hypothetical protein